MAGRPEKNDAVLRFVARRVALTVPVLLGVATLVFSLIHLIPGDPAQAMLGEAAPEADVAALRAQLGLDRPLLEQYADFLGGLVRGDLGTSLRTGTSVTRQIAERLPATFELALAAMFVAVAVALPLGVAAAAWRGTAIDHSAMAVAMAGMSIPNFWLGPLLAIVFAVELGWLPVSGRGGVEHLVLPAVSLVHAVIVHAFRNSLIPVVTILGLQFGAVLTGAVITETIFAWPGIGRLLIQSIGFRDYPLVQGCILLIAVTYVAVNLITDLAYGVLDPRIRYE
jgi:peptide/nickel transport system permease protein